MGSSSIDLSLSNIWNSWFNFRKGKKSSKELEKFSYYLEGNLYKLYLDINNNKYEHGSYSKFVVADNKRREISVAGIQDRIVHRLVYDYLNEIYDKTFIFDAWSCRKNKGLLGAIERVEKFLNKYPFSFIWRADIKKFFDNVDHQILMKALSFRITDKRTRNLLWKIIKSYRAADTERERFRGSKKGIPIGNLTSQIFANIYLNELDRFVKYNLKQRVYVRYGDDFIIIADRLNELQAKRKEIIRFLKEKLHLEINPRNSIMLKIKHGLKFLGVEIFSKGRRLNKRNWNRVKTKLKLKNISSCSGLVKKHSSIKRRKEFSWLILKKLKSEIN